MDMQNLPDLMTFVMVVDEDSFSAAAKKLGLSHSVISRRITRLENELGVQLLQRTTRRLSMTEAGRAIYERAKQIQRDIEEVSLTVSASQQELRGTLRINAPMSFGQLHLMPAICEFMEQYPDLRIELLLGRQYANLIEESLDISIQISELPDSSFIAKTLMHRNTIVCATPKYLAQYGTPQKPEDLKQHNCLLYQEKRVHNDWRFIRNKEEFSVKVSGNLIINSSQAVAKAALASLGIARLPNYLIMHEINTGNLVSLIPEYCPKDIGIYAVYSHRKYLAKKVRVFVDFLVKKFSEDTYWNKIHGVAL